jgi:gas vesicle structural protein
MLLELVDRILDKGIVIDAWARVSVLSIELLTIEARVVVASVDTYLRYAEAIGNTALASMPRPQAAQQARAMPASGQQQGQLGGQQVGGQPVQSLPQPQQQYAMPQMPQRQGQPQQVQQQPMGQPAQPQQQVPPQQQQQPGQQPGR